MKYYSPEIVKKFIEDHCNRIRIVELGMSEDWFWTAGTIYINGKLSVDLSKDKVEIAGIPGSTWATPVMMVTYTDGTVEELPCFVDDGNCEDPSLVAEQMAFVRSTQ